MKKLKHAGCPKKREEEASEKRKKAAKKAADDTEKGRICALGTTYGDMNVDKSTPSLGVELRAAWDKKHAEWVKKDAIAIKATKAHKKAKASAEKTLAAFRTAVTIEASNTNKACKAAKAQYEALARDVASNVKTRKTVYITSKVVGCYADNLANNAKAKGCADKAHKADTSIWDINGGKLKGCPSTATLSTSFGPASWKPTYANCGEHRSDKAEGRAKAAKKEKEAKAALKAHIEKVGKATEKRIKKVNELKSKAAEKSRKATEKKSKENADKAKKRKEKANKDAAKRKELKTKAHERQIKAKKAEQANKARIKSERKQKNTCTVKAYEHNNYGGKLLSQTTTCTSHRNIRLSQSGRRRGFLASSFRLSSGCRSVQLWDQDACKENYRDNVNIKYPGVPSVKYDLNDDICGYTVRANANGWCRL